MLKLVYFIGFIILKVPIVRSEDGCHSQILITYRIFWLHCAKTELSFLINQKRKMPKEENN